MLRRRFTNKKGMTLIEIIMGISLFSILSVTTAAIINPVMSAVKDVSSYSELNGMLDNLANEITADLSEAAVVSSENGKVTVTTTGYYVVDYQVEDGILFKNGAPLIAEGFYKGKRVDFGVYDAELSDTDDENSYKSVSPNTKIFLLLLKICDSNGNLLMSKVYIIKPLVSNQYN